MFIWKKYFAQKQQHLKLRLTQVIELIMGSESFVSFSFIDFLPQKKVFGRGGPFSADVFSLCCPSCPIVADSLVISGSLQEARAEAVGTSEEVSQAGPHHLTRSHMTKQMLIAAVVSTHRAAPNIALQIMVSNEALSNICQAQVGIRNPWLLLLPMAAKGLSFTGPDIPHSLWKCHVCISGLGIHLGKYT